MNTHLFRHTWSHQRECCTTNTQWNLTLHTYSTAVYKSHTPLFPNWWEWRDTVRQAHLETLIGLWLDPGRHFWHSQPCSVPSILHVTSKQPDLLMGMMNDHSVCVFEHVNVQTCMHVNSDSKLVAELEACGIIWWINSLWWSVATNQSKFAVATESDISTGTHLLESSNASLTQTENKLTY